ncbi:MAG: hypothetical protein NC121_01435 [Blautia sp.]|nr:hypothetical protein [Blautia sp.]
MNKEQLAERIGNMDDRLIQEAGQIQDSKRRKSAVIFRRCMAAVAVLALMVCSGAVGAVAFAREVEVEVPARQEAVVIDDIGVTLILPDSWKGHYVVVEGAYGALETPMWEFCSKLAYDAPEAADGTDYRGTLFYVIRYAEYSMSAEEFAEEGIAGMGRYLFSTEAATYALMYTTDVEIDPDDPAQVEEFNALEQTIREIQIVLDGRMDKLTDQMVSMGILEPDMQADDGKNLVWEDRQKIEIDGVTCYAFELRYSDDENINGEMTGRLLSSYAVSEDGMRFYWYNPADDVWEEMVAQGM